MRTQAAVLYEMGKPAPYARSAPLALEELELSGPQEGEVLVEIAGAGLCHSDLSVIDGSRPRAMPMVMGHEASGIVREVGSGVDGFKAGDLVVFSFVPVCGRCGPCATGRSALCENGARANAAGTLLSGGRRFRNSGGKELNHHLGVSAFSRYTVAAQESLVKVDASISPVKAALFGCAVMTGVGAAINTAKVEPGSSVVVFGLGGVGLSVIMGAKVSGASPIVAVDVVDSKLELARRIGATHAVNAKSPEAEKAVKDLTSGGGDCVFEAVGNEQVLKQAYAATRRGGKTVLIGLPHPSKQFVVPAVSLVAEERVVMGSYMGSAVPRRDLPRLIAMYQAGLLPVDLLFSRAIRLDEINGAFDSLASGESVRQIIGFQGGA